jgi:hypothetical protein
LDVPCFEWHTTFCVKWCLNMHFPELFSGGFGFAVIYLGHWSHNATNEVYTLCRIDVEQLENLWPREMYKVCLNTPSSSNFLSSFMFFF